MSETILFLPGLLCDARLWAYQTQTFSDRHDCVIADMTQDDNLGDMVRRAIAGLPERFSAVGLSMGGYAAMELMRIAPERVLRLALLDTSSHADTPERIAGRQGLIARVEEGAFEEVIEGHFKTFVHPAHLADARLMAGIRASAMAVGPDAYVRQQHAIMGRPDNRPLLKAIDCPTLVLCGAEDALTPPLHDEMAGLIPGAELVKVPNCGHMSPMEQPDAVNAALMRWLDRT